MDNQISTGRPFPAGQMAGNSNAAGPDSIPAPPEYYPGERSVSAMQAPPPQPNRIREIRINQLDHGYMVTCGCQTFAIENADKLINKLNQYLHDPQATEDKYYKKELF